MRKTGQAVVFSDGAVWRSLSAIKQAHSQLHLLAGMRTSPTVLASKIELCDVLLDEISGIRRSLARDLKQTRGPPASGHLGISRVHRGFNTPSAGSATSWSRLPTSSPSSAARAVPARSKANACRKSRECLAV
jgi:hypothetical protein